jgi:hypothetical protein
MRPGPAVSPTVTGHPGGRPAHAHHRAAVPSFSHLLASVMARSHVPRAGHSAMAAGPAVDPAAFQVAAVVAGPAIAATRVASIPASVDAALGRAMHIEGVPQSWQPALRFIMAQESAGKVDARNHVHSARGLFHSPRRTIISTRTACYRSAMPSKRHRAEFAISGSDMARRTTPSNSANSTAGIEHAAAGT